MVYRSPLPNDITAVLMQGECSHDVICNAVRSIELIELLLDLKSFDRVAQIYSNEYQFLENHVLQYEVHFKNFYNALLERLKIGEDQDLEDEDTYDDCNGSDYDD